MMTQKDPYDILGVKRDASADEIKRAYRHLAKEHHPDRNPGNPAAEGKFKEVQAAYEVLRDPQKRRQYDQFGAGGPTPDFAQWTAGAGGSPFRGSRVDIGSFDDLSSIFEQFFARGGMGGGGRRGRRARSAPVEPGPPLETAVEVSFDEALAGAKREIVLQSDQPGERPERIEFRVPVGVSDGQRIRLRGKGHPGPGGRGDLLITVRVHPHPYFRRSGDDLLLDVPLSVSEAALGAKIEIPTPQGTGRIAIPAGAGSGAKLRLRGKGMPRPDGSAGDLFAVLKIEAPKTLSDEARRLFEQLRPLEDDPRARTGWRL